jgi:hypothetical protein
LLHIVKHINEKTLRANYFISKFFGSDKI